LIERLIERGLKFFPRDGQANENDTSVFEVIKVTRNRVRFP